MTRLRTAALVGNPNSGKSALFNALTGARQMAQGAILSETAVHRLHARRSGVRAA